MKHYLFASDFDQTLSFNDSGLILSEMLGVSGFEERVAGMARINLAQQGGELAYLLLHDPEFRRVRKEHLIEAGKRIRLKQNIRLLPKILSDGIEGYQFSFYVISAAPEEVIQSALEGIVPPDHIFGSSFNYHPQTGEIESVVRVPAGYGKVATLDELQERLQISSDRIIYVGDGGSDIHVMLHVNRRDGFTVAVSENKYIAPIAKRSILSEDALSPLVPVLEEIVGITDPASIRSLFESHGLRIQEWDKVKTDWLKIGEIVPKSFAYSANTQGSGND
ncbi:MAG TPA: haloacid dehalogenase-like hydrolase [Blastocatellia bacterium]|nr:haloacid dehalogenase-like hydrolase [Blastocatellia bacterium]